MIYLLYAFAVAFYLMVGAFCIDEIQPLIHGWGEDDFPAATRAFSLIFWPLFVVLVLCYVACVVVDASIQIGWRAIRAGVHKVLRFVTGEMI